jgi:3-phosphoshikimate 1-carboxyvinyltransferase
MVEIKNLSEAADTVALESAIQQVKNAGDTEITVDIGPAGTAMRFLSAFLPLNKGEFILTGSERMKQRPIGILSNAMKSLGANIEFIENEGFPPLKITGPFKQESAEVTVKGNISSQYLSALLLISSNLPQGLKLNIDGELTSRPYLEMTLDMLKETGIQHSWEGNQIHIAPQSPNVSTLFIEPDWSAASYWYSIVALAEEADLLLPGLKPSSLQGDQEIKDIMLDFGVLSVFTKDGLKLTKTKERKVRETFNLISCPDLAQTVIVCCAALGYEPSFTGLETLKIKETDRILALQNELAKFGVRLYEEEKEVYRLDCSKRFNPDTLTIKTYEDHRMAMAFAPLALIFKELIIEEPEVVEKSYPLFWKHLEQVGFKIN